MSKPKYIVIAYIVLSIVLVSVARSAQDVALEYIYSEAMENIDISATDTRENSGRNKIVVTYSGALKGQYESEVTYKAWSVVVIKYIIQILAIYFCASMIVAKLKHVPSNT